MNNTLQFCVYKITNSISGKSYIGKTKDLKNRWNRHKNNSKNTNINNKFPNALRKYLENSWNVSILYETDDENHCYEVEKILINEYDTFHNGYNSCGGGIGVGSGENNPMYNKIVSKETRKKHSIAKSGENNPMYNKTHSEETKKQMGIARSGKNNPMFGIKGKNHPKFGILPWKTPSCKSRGLEINWFYMDKIYDLRIKYGYGPKRMFEILILDYPNIKNSKKSFQNMFRWIEKNGNPKINKDWLDFHNNY